MPQAGWQTIIVQRRQMCDLGTSVVASVARDPGAVAIVDAELRLTYAQWYARISSVVAAFDDLGLRPGDHIVTVLQNRWEAATIHWACQFAGIVITPVNWRAKADELDFCIENSESKALVYEEISAEAVAASQEAGKRPRVAIGFNSPGDIPFEQLLRTHAEG